MTISDELQKLAELRRNGTISEDEFELAKKRVLEGPQEVIPSAQLEELRAHAELMQLDREWALDREKYMISGKYGRKYGPGKAGSVIAGASIVVCGILYILIFTSGPLKDDGPFSPFVLFGASIILLGAGMGVHWFLKACRYEEAEQRYQRRRQEIQDRNRPL
jgi:hypothetical protein